MSDLSSILPGGAGPVGPVNRVGVTPPAGAAPADSTGEAVRREVDAPRDRVEVSNFARYMDLLRHLPEARLDKVQAARQAISQGRYDSQAVLDQTIERLGEDL